MDAGPAGALPTAVDAQAIRALLRIDDALRAADCEPLLRGATLVRLAVCYFAQDTGIFAADALSTWLAERTDAGALGAQLSDLFRRLGATGGPAPTGMCHIPGGLFDATADALPGGQRLLAAARGACAVSWRRIPPTILGSMLQRGMDGPSRRDQGVHYTSEDNILRVLRPLLLDELHTELAEARNSPRRLRELHARLARIQLLDPSCGCGDFLAVAYRQLRELELQLLAALDVPGQLRLEFDEDLCVQLGQCHGIELDPLAADVARSVLWLVDHQMGLHAADTLGHHPAIAPPQTSPNIVCADALEVPWTGIAPACDDMVILGNPPFGGKKELRDAPRAQLARLWSDIRGGGQLDLVCAWFRLAAEHIGDTAARCAFVSTNSITQGEQAGILFRYLHEGAGVHITFAHRSFRWTAQGAAAANVHVVIVGLGARPPATRRLFDGDGVREVEHINGYLCAAPDAFVTSRPRPLCDVPSMQYGSMMLDRARGAARNAGLLLEPHDRTTLLSECPELSPFIRPLLGGDEFINGIERHCLWLVDAPPSLLDCSTALRERIDRVRAFRAGSGRAQTRRLARAPMLFGEIRQPSTSYLLVPKVSSEARPYLPIGFVDAEVIASGSALVVPDATVYDFGVLSSAMHDAWVRTVAGRLKSDLQYSSTIVYNNFPWPLAPTVEQRAIVEAAARGVLEARRQPGGATLAELYRAGDMPEDLRRAHRLLDATVDRLYGCDRGGEGLDRIHLLFERHARLTAG